MDDVEPQKGTNRDKDAYYQKLVNKLPTRAPIFLPTEKYSIDEKIAGIETVHAIYTDRLKSVYKPQLQALREKYKGVERAFIIGNGPSLNKTDLTQLENEVTFCVNGFFLKAPELSWTPTFYVVEDHLVAEDRANEINSFKGPTKLFPAYLGYCLDEGSDTIFFNHRPRKSFPDGFDFSTNADQITYAGCTVTFTCLQLAHYLGFKQIFLIGVDADYDLPSDVKESEDYGVTVLDMESDDINHFHPDYFGKGYRWHDPQVHKMLEAYAEAENTTKALLRPIYNATIGGKLEVFERKAFAELFPDAIPATELEKLTALDDLDAAAEARKKLAAARDAKIPSTAHSKFPKLLVLDPTEIGGGTATGELKKTLLSDWPKSRLLQTFSKGKDSFGIEGGMLHDANGKRQCRNPEDVLDIIHQFNPDGILYRPTGEKPHFQRLARTAIEQSGAPLAIWIMDAWHDRLKAEDHAMGSEVEKHLENLISKSAKRLSICDSMSEVYSKRYSQNFEKFSNCVDPKQWRSKPGFDGTKNILLVRYCGSFVPNMSLESLVNVAEAVETLAKERPVKFEISSRSNWVRQFGHRFDKFTHTSIETGVKDEAAYKSWLQDADINVIAYDFNDEAMLYTKFSMANKLPECLASGSLLLVVGPVGQATVDFVTKNNLGVALSKPGSEAILETLSHVDRNTDALNELAQYGQKFAFSKMRLADERSRFCKMISELVLSERREPVARPKRVRPNSVDPLNTKSGRLGRFIKENVQFYRGLKGIVAILIVVLFSLPAWPFLSIGWIGDIAAFGPAVGAALVLLLFGNWIRQILDELQ